MYRVCLPKANPRSKLEQPVRALSSWLSEGNALGLGVTPGAGMSDTTQPASGWPTRLARSRHQPAEAAAMGPADAEEWWGVTSAHPHLFIELTLELASAFFLDSQAAGTRGKWVSCKGVWQLYVWYVLISHENDQGKASAYNLCMLLLPTEPTLCKQRREMVDGRNLYRDNLGDKRIWGSWPKVCLGLCLYNILCSPRLREVILRPRPLSWMLITLHSNFLGLNISSAIP